MNNINLDGAVLSGKRGTPALPYYPISLILPEGEDASSITIRRSGRVELEGIYHLAPMQGSKPISSEDRSITAKIESIYNSDKPFPVEAGSNISTYYLNGYSIALSTFTPFEYSPKSGNLYFYQDIEVEVESETTPNAMDALANLSSSPKIVDRVKLLVQNDEMINSYQSKTYPADAYEIAIISSSSFDFSTIVDFYNERGLKTRFTDVEDIYSGYSGIDNQEKIRNFIIDQYQNKAVSHILLGGDVEVIPYRGFYCEVQSSSLYTDSNIPSDLYYSAFDGDWNSDGDNRWGEIGEDDLLPEISVG